MRIIPLLAISLLFFSCSKNYTLYEVGRPRSIEENNARQIVSEKWRVNFEFKSGLDEATINETLHHNDSVSKLISKKKGENWLDEFTSESIAELETNTTLRTRVKALNIYTKATNDLFEPIILFEKKGKKYLAHIVGQQKTDETRAFITYAQIWVYPNSEKTSIKSEKIEPLMLRFPQNGVN
jgi:hypothetical protein